MMGSKGCANIQYFTYESTISKEESVPVLPQSVVFVFREITLTKYILKNINIYDI